jgi:WD40 repeat protein
MAKKIAVSLIIFFTAALPVFSSGDSETQKETLYPQLGYSSVDRIVFSPDGKTFAAFSIHGDMIKLFDFRSMMCIGSFVGHSGRLYTAAFSPDGGALVSCASDNTVRIWDVASRKATKTITVEKVQSAAFGPSAKRIVTGSADKAVTLWNVDTGKEIVSYETNTENIPVILYDPELQYIAYADGNNIEILNTRTASIEKTLSGHSKNVSSMAFSPDGRYLISGSEDAAVKVWNIPGPNTGAEFSMEERHTKTVRSVGFSGDGKYLFSFSSDKTVLFDYDKKSVSLTIEKNENDQEPVCAVLSPDSARIITGFYPRGNGAFFVVYDAKNGAELSRIVRNNEAVYSAAINTEGNSIAAASGDNTVKVWDIFKGKMRTLLRGHTEPVTAAGFSGDGGQIASASNDNRIIIWDAKTADKLQSFFAHSAEIYTLSFSTTGDRILSAGSDAAVKMWNAGNASRLWARKAPGSWVSAYSAFSRDGKYTASGYHSIHIRDSETGSLLRELPGHEEEKAIRALDFSPDGKYLASGSADKNIIIWDWEKGVQAKGKMFTGHTGTVSALNFSPDGKKLVSGAYDKTLILWDTEKGLIRKFSGHEGGITSVRFTPNGRAVISSSADGTLRIWNAETGREAAQFIGFSDGEWVCISSDGYYNASQAAREGGKYLAAASGTELRDMGDYKARFFKPEIVAERLRSLLQIEEE